MAKFIVLSVLDRLACEYRGVYLERNANVGARRFGDAVRSGQMEGIKGNAGDFALVAVGEFDDETGALVNYENNEVVVEVRDIVRLTERDTSHDARIMPIDGLIPTGAVDANGEVIHGA